MSENFVPVPLLIFVLFLGRSVLSEGIILKIKRQKISNQGIKKAAT
jgi:hypothetical protein